MRRIISILATVLCAVALTACNPEKSLVKPLIMLDPSVLETKTEDIPCTVTKLYTTTDTKTDTDMEYSYGYGYNTASGKYENFYGLHPKKESVVVTEYYAVLTDENGKAFRFEFDGEDFALLQEEQEITVQSVKRYMSDESLYDSKFYWGESEIIFDEDVTEMMSHDTSMSKEIINKE